MHSNRYTQFILTVIAVLLAWNLFATKPTPVHAQIETRYRAEPVSLHKPFVAEQLNGAAKGAELLMIVPLGLNDGSAIAVFKAR